MNKKDIIAKIDNILQERLFNAIKQLNVSKRRDAFKKSHDYLSCTDNEKNNLISERSKIWYKQNESFYLSYYSIFALYPLVKREKQILGFDSQKITVVRVDYQEHNGIPFTATHNTRFTADMRKEVDDCISELIANKDMHFVDNYKPVNDFEVSPHSLLTFGTLKYNCFYSFQFEYSYTTYLAEFLFNANLITDFTSSGLSIDDDFVEEMISVLNLMFNDEVVLQRKRIMEDPNNSNNDRECIRPVKISFNYSPKKISTTTEFKNIEFKDKREMEDAIKLYEFIFNITLSTQLKNSVYDASVVDIMVGQHKLKQKAHVLIDGQENWELLSGNIIKKIKDNDNTEQGQSKTVILPQFKHDDKLIVKSVYEYDYNSRRPRRYGFGRFATQVLEKNSIGSVAENDEIMNNLVSSKAVKRVQLILHPQEISLFFIDWIEQYAPLLIDPEFFKEFNEKIKLVEEDEFGIDSILEELNIIIDNAFTKANYTEYNLAPSNAKIALVKAIAQRNNIELDIDILNSNSKCDIFIASYPSEEPIKVGRCLSCNSIVFQKEYLNSEGKNEVYYSCEKSTKENKCFVFWDKKIESFFAENGLNLYTVNERREVLKKLLSRKKGYLFSGLVDKLQNRYDAKIGLLSFIPKDKKNEVWYLKVLKKEQKTYTDVKPLSNKKEVLFDTKESIIPKVATKDIPRAKNPLKEECIKIANIHNQKLGNEVLDNDILLKEYIQSHTSIEIKDLYTMKDYEHDIVKFYSSIKTKNDISLVYIEILDYNNNKISSSEQYNKVILNILELLNNYRSRLYKYSSNELLIILMNIEEDDIKSMLEIFKNNIKLYDIKINKRIAHSKIIPNKDILLKEVSCK